ncbi:MAG: hypothetical protein WC862_01715 [Patescibacteria group bacterium]
MKKIIKSSKLQCAFCQGRGIQPGAGSLSCIVCRGSGRVRARQPYSLCKECGGRGKKESATLYCLPCHGKGFVEESRQPLVADPPIVPKTGGKKRKRRKGEIRKRKLIKKSKKKITSKKLITPLPKVDSSKREKIIETKTVVKKERKSFFKKLLGAIKIL